MNMYLCLVQKAACENLNPAQPHAIFRSTNIAIERLGYGWYIVGVDTKYISSYGPLLHEDKMHIQARVMLVS